MSVLTKQECEVTAARGHQRPDGGVAFSGLLWVRGRAVASFANEGRGGCAVWTERVGEARQLLAEFDELAVREYPDYRFEQRDHLAGALWDAAVLKSQPKPRKRNRA